MGASASGLTHLKSGHRIIEEDRKKQAAIAPEVTDYIEPIVRGFLAKSEAYALHEEPTYPADSTGIPVSTSRTAYTVPSMPNRFTSLAHANKHLKQAVYLVLLLELGSPHHSTAMIPSVRKYVLDWFDAFRRWKVGASFDMEEPLSKDWQLLLLAHHRMALIILRTLPPENDSNYTRAAADFRIMFAQMRTFLRSGYTAMEEGKEADLILKTHLGFISPLYFIATLCRVHEIRDGALEALLELKVVEGHWNSCVAYAVAKTVVEIEEEYEVKEIKVRRVKVDSVDRLEGGKLELRYHKIPGEGTHADTVTRLIAEPCCHHETAMMWVGDNLIPP